VNKREIKKSLGIEPLSHGEWEDKEDNHWIENMQGSDG